MASSTIYSALAVPLEDSMEVSSPGAGTFDHDIDIDFEDYGARAPSVEDDRMLEDGEQNRPGTANDEEMGDDEHGLDIQPAEEVMRDDPAPLEVAQADEDDELIDYDDLDYQTAVPDHGINATAQNTGAASIGSSETVLPQDPNPNRVEDTGPSGPVTTNYSEAQSEHVAGGAAAAPAPHSSPLSASHETEPASQEVAVDATTAPVDLVGTETQAQEAANKDSEPSTAQVPDTAGSPAVNDATDDPNSAVGRADHDPTPTDTGLHPMTLRYGDMQLPLFKARTQPDGLLKDDNLASVSLAELFQSCRQELATLLGDEISQDQDFVLGVDHLGILLVEESRSSFETSLNDILEVFLHLHQNDGTEDVPPLSLTLSLQLKFASSLALLKEAASQGRGISSFSSLHSADNVEEYYNDEEDEDALDDHHQAEAEAEANAEGDEEFVEDLEAQSGARDTAATSAQVDDSKAAAVDDKAVDGVETAHAADDQSHLIEARASPAHDDTAPAAAGEDVPARDDRGEQESVTAGDNQGEQDGQFESYENGEDEFAEEFYEGDEEETGDVADSDVHSFDPTTQETTVEHLEAASTISSVTAQGEPVAPSQDDAEPPEEDADDDAAGKASASTNPAVDAEKDASATTTTEHAGVADGQDAHDPTIAGSDDLAFNLYPEELSDKRDGDDAAEEGAENVVDDAAESGELDDNDLGEIADNGDFDDFENFDQTDFADEETHYPNEEAENETSAGPDALADSLDPALDANATQLPQDALDEADNLDFQDDDDLGFDDPDNDSGALEKPASAQTPPSALGKRSFESHADDSLAEDNEPESKIARSG